MIPSCSKPKYKALVKLRLDVWQNLKIKNLKKKKWRLLIANLKKSQKFKKRSHILNYEITVLPRFRVYFRYKYQKNLFIRQTIKFIYGSLQDYKIKYMARNNNNWRDFAQSLEQSAPMFLYRSKLSSSYKEAQTNYKHQRILVNGNYLTSAVKKGDVLHFEKNYERVLRKRIKYMYNKRHYYIKRKEKYNFSSVVDFDVISFRFYFIDNISYFKNHPFILPLKRIWRYYTKV
jgi:ribosomal protein S4